MSSELTLELCYFQSSRCKIFVFDLGHGSYVHEDVNAKVKSCRSTGTSTGTIMPSRNQNPSRRSGLPGLATTNCNGAPGGHRPTFLAGTDRNVCATVSGSQVLPTTPTCPGSAATAVFRMITFQMAVIFFRLFSFLITLLC